MSPQPSWQLLLGNGQQVPLGKSELRLGREAGSVDVLIASAKVSRVHCTVWVDEQGQAWVRDLGSANGTAVDGRRVTDHAMLRGGSLLKMGDVEVRVVHQEPRRQVDDEGAERGYVFVRGSAPWAALGLLPSASPTFDTAVAIEALEAEDRARGRSAVLTEIDDSGSGLIKLLGLLCILLAAAIAFFVLSTGKLDKRLAEMTGDKSEFRTAERENQVMQPTIGLLSSDRLAAKPVALCNRSARPVVVQSVSVAVPLTAVMPDQPVLGSFNSGDCKPQGLGVTVAPGETLSGASISANTPCRIPETAYLVAAEYTAAGEQQPRWAATPYGEGIDCLPLTLEDPR
jgi:hypothetical protein